jgi:hypothetical protein
MRIGDVVGTRVENILYFFKARVVGKHGRKDIWECWKGFKKKSFEAIGVKMDIIKAINIKIYEGEIKSHILKVMVVKMIL